MDGLRNGREGYKRVRKIERGERERETERLCPLRMAHPLSLSISGLSTEADMGDLIINQLL